MVTRSRFRCATPIQRQHRQRHGAASEPEAEAELADQVRDRETLHGRLVEDSVDQKVVRGMQQRAGHALPDAWRSQAKKMPIEITMTAKQVI